MRGAPVVGPAQGDKGGGQRSIMVSNFPCGETLRLRRDLWQTLMLLPVLAGSVSSMQMHRRMNKAYFFSLLLVSIILEKKKRKSVQFFFCSSLSFALYLLFCCFLVGITRKDRQIFLHFFSLVITCCIFLVVFVFIISRRRKK